MNRIWLAIGILCFLVPVLLQVSDKREQESVIDTYQKIIEEYDTEEVETCLKQAKKYNSDLYELKKSAVGEEILLDYESQLNLTKTGMMGHLYIPDINLKLPVYHGTSDEVLTNGIGHLEGTSLPVGGDNSHAVLTGHCGLPSAELFTRLDELGKGDEFFLKVCNQTICYEVVDIQVVEPSRVDVIDIEAHRDLVTLITCTPYGINTHRLLVKGERTHDEEIIIEETEKEGGVDEKIYYIVGAFVLLFLLLLCGSVYWKFRYCNK